MKNVTKYYGYGGPYPKKMTGGSTSPRKLPSYRKGGSASLLTQISKAPKKKKGMRGCGCGGQV